MIDRATIDKILDATNIVDVVGEFVTLRKAGVNYKGLCPFHDDTTPSFMVSPAKQICHCFACGEGGNAVNFLMKHEQITYPEALRWLARKYNIDVQEREMSDEEKQQQSERESMFIVNEWAMKYFQDMLMNDPDGIAIGKQYFRGRGIRDDIVAKFNLGYALQKRDALALAAQKAGYQSEFLTKTGLCIDGEKGLHDRYAGRVIFPWLNVSGKVVAFGGRLLDSRTKGVQQKYVNSPDSEIYHKERELYGLFQAKKTIAKEDCVYMVEGYTDVIAMHQCGIENVVANSGTALSNYQIRLLRRFTQNITLLYDGDEAGIHAAMRGTDMLLAEGMNVKVLLLPDGDDPDSFSRKHSASELKAYIDANQQDFIAFKTHLTVDPVTDPVKRSQAITGIIKSISVINDPVLRSEYVKQLSQSLQLNEGSLINSMNKMIKQDQEDKQKERDRELHRQTNTDQPAEETPAETSAEVQQPYIGLHDVDEHTLEIERLLIQMVVRKGEEIAYENVETEDGEQINLNVAQYVNFELNDARLQFHDPRFTQILYEAVTHSGDEGFKAENYFMQHPDADISELATQLAVDTHQLGKGFQLRERQGSLCQRLEHLVCDLFLNEARLLLKQANAEIVRLSREGGSDEEKRAAMENMRDLVERQKEYSKRLGRVYR